MDETPREKFIEVNRKNFKMAPKGSIFQFKYYSLWFAFGSKDNVLGSQSYPYTDIPIVKTQFLNEHTKHWQARDAQTGKVLDVKEDGTPYKNLPKE